MAFIGDKWEYIFPFLFAALWHAPLGAAKGGRGRWGPGFPEGAVWGRYAFHPPHRGPLELPPSGCLCCDSLEDVSKSCPWSVWLLDRPLSVYRGNHFCSLSHRLAVARALTTRSLCGSEGTGVRGFQTSWQLLSWSSHPGHNQLFVETVFCFLLHCYTVLLLLFSC